MRRSKPLRISDFSGGLNTTSPNTSIQINQALDLQNINLLPNGGFKSRFGNTAFNSSAMASGAAVHGLDFYRQADLDEWLIAISGTGVFASTSLNGTMTDITGAVTVTTGANNIWTFSEMNDLAIFVGGAPDAPIKWSGSGNAAALGGSPPNGEFCFQLNNYFFIGNTASNPSRIQWSILGNPEDWAGTGSGSQDVSKNDGDTLVGAGQIGVDTALLLKQNSIHQMIVRNPPFPVFPLFKNIGAVSKRGIVQAEGLLYFITPEPRMKATDGTSIIDFPTYLDTTWDSLSKSRLKYIQGLYYPKLRQIWWFCTNGSASTNNYCIVWDLERKAWLRHPTGYKMNCACIAQDRVAYGGAYDGKIYRLDNTAAFSDASETSPGAIDGYLQSGWLDLESMINSKSFPYVELNFATQNTGTFDFSYGFDFSSNRKTESISMVGPGAKYGSAIYGVDVYGGQSDRSKIIIMKGNGKFFQYRIRHNSASEGFGFNRMEIPIKNLAPLALR